MVEFLKSEMGIPVSSPIGKVGNVQGIAAEGMSGVGTESLLH